MPAGRSATNSSGRGQGCASRVRGVRDLPTRPLQLMDNHAPTNTDPQRTSREILSSVRDPVFAGVAVGGYSQLAAGGPQLAHREPAVTVATQGDLLEYFQDEASVASPRSQRLQDGAIRQSEFAITDTLVQPRERAPEQGSSFPGRESWLQPATSVMALGGMIRTSFVSWQPKLRNGYTNSDGSQNLSS